MGDIIVNEQNSKDSLITEESISSLTSELLVEARSLSVPEDSSICLPIAQLETLGGGVSSLVPAFRTITQTSSTDMAGLYQLANEGIGDTLKRAKDGTFWGAFKKADGASKMAKLKAADPVTTTNKLVMNANPATMMMAFALFSLEKEIGNIKEMQKEILSFLELEKESEIEADVITLTEVITKYKHNWDNSRYIGSNHKLVCDIQRTARKNLLLFQKQVSEELKSKSLIVAGNKVNSTMKSLQKKFAYYRLSLYTFSLSSFSEIMLSGNFREENIKSAIDTINKSSDEYRKLFSECSMHLEKMSKGSVETNVLKGIGVASNAVGKFIGSIPKVKDGPVDEFLIDKGERIKGSADSISKSVIESFSDVHNPNTKGIVDRLEDMNTIYNRTSAICFDDANMYLLIS